MNRLTMLLAATAAAGTVAMATGCGSTTTTVTVPPAQSAGSGSSPSAVATPASTGAAGGSTPGAATVAKCPTRDLKATLGPVQGAAGSVYVALQLTNIGSAACTLYGFPGVSLAGGSPVTQISPGADRSNTVPKTLVTLAPGAMAFATLQVAQAGNYPAATCAPKATTYLQIFPPDQTTAIYLAYSSTACTKPVHQLWISAVKAGSGR